MLKKRNKKIKVLLVGVVDEPAAEKRPLSVFVRMVVSLCRVVGEPMVLR